MAVKRIVTAAVVTCTTVAAFGVWTPTAALADPTCAAQSPSAVGLPLWEDARGAVELRSGSDRTVISRASLGLGEGVPADRFGAAVLGPIDSDGDACPDFVVGAPGAGGTGMVYVLRGLPEGRWDAYGVSLPNARPGDQFGSSLSAEEVTLSPVVVVGAPGRDVGRATDAGVIAWFRPRATGGGVVEVVSQASAGVAGSPESGDRFGEVLSRPFTQRESALDVLVGVPREDVGGLTDAGIVEQVTLVGNGGGPSSRVYRQEPGGPMGVPEPGDRFGSALALNDDIDSNTLAVGVPGEDIGAVRDAGAVNLLSDSWTFPNDVDYRPRRAVTQRSQRVPGEVESGDRFGAALAATFYCPADQDGSGSSSPEFVIGAPGEDLGEVADAGMVVTYDTGLLGDGTTVPACPSYLVRQDGLAAGHAEAGDQLGADLATRDADILVAVPGEDVGAVRDAGLVAVISTNPFAQQPAEQFSGGPQSGLRYATLP